MRTVPAILGMRIHPLPLDALRQWRSTNPNARRSDDHLVIFQAEAGDGWRGFLVGSADWRCGGFLPASPGLTIPAALKAWLEE